MTNTRQADRTHPRTKQRERNRAMLLANIAGKSFEAIAQQHSLSRQRAIDIVRREEREYLDQLETDLMVAGKVGVGFPSFLVPFDSEDEWQRPMAEFVWALTHLRRRHVRLDVTTQQLAEGTSFLLSPKETK